MPFSRAYCTRRSCPRSPLAEAAGHQDRVHAGEGAGALALDLLESTSGSSPWPEAVAGVRQRLRERLVGLRQVTYLPTIAISTSGPGVACLHHALPLAELGGRTSSRSCSTTI